MRVTGLDPVTGRTLCVTVEGDVIADVRPAPDPGDGLWLAPGLVDLQVNGFAGHDVNAADVTPRTVADGVATAVAMAGLPLAEALRLATANPGRFASGRGTLRPGAAADLITFAWRPGDRTLDIHDVVARGTQVAAR